jgi:hypothetical protein
MPAGRLSKNPIHASEFCVLGTYKEYDERELNLLEASETHTAPIRHVALLSPYRAPGRDGVPGSYNHDLYFNSHNPCDHVTIDCIALNSSKHKWRCHVIGYCGTAPTNHLTEEQRDRLEAFIKAINDCHFSYLAHPPIWERRAEDGRFDSIRYSCVGFVLACFRAIGIELLADVNSKDFPVISKDELATIFPEIANSTNDELCEVGLDFCNYKELPVAVPGYVFYALKKLNSTDSFEPFPPTRAQVRF